VTSDFDAGLGPAALGGGVRCAGRAVEELAAPAGPEAIPPLLLSIGDESWPVRQAAAEALVAFRDETLLPALESALRDGENAGLRNAAMEIYVKTGPARRRAADAPGRRRRGGAQLRGGDAGRARERQAVEPLIAALGDEDVNVRHAAAASLGQVGDARAVPALVQVLKSEPWLQYPRSTPWARSASRRRRRR
jgi:HEAT repeat protein